MVLGGGGVRGTGEVVQTRRQRLQIQEEITNRKPMKQLAIDFFNLHIPYIYYPSSRIPSHKLRTYLGSIYITWYILHTRIVVTRAVAKTLNLFFLAVGLISLRYVSTHNRPHLLFTTLVQAFTNFPLINSIILRIRTFCTQG